MLLVPTAQWKVSVPLRSKEQVVLKENLLNRLNRNPPPRSEGNSVTVRKQQCMDISMTTCRMAEYCHSPAV